MEHPYAICEATAIEAETGRPFVTLLDGRGNSFEFTLERDTARTLIAELTEVLDDYEPV